MIITLLTDLGTKDATAASIKAALTAIVPDAVVTDLSHHVMRDNAYEAGYLLSTAYRSFPEGTAHVCIVAPFMPAYERMILIQHGGQYFIGPDNGVLPVALGAASIANCSLCAAYTTQTSILKWVSDAGNILSQIQKGAALPPAGFEAMVLPLLPAPQVTPINIVCRILYADRYNNLVLNMTKTEFETMTGNRPFRIKTFKGVTITEVSTHYSDVAHGAPLCRFNKNGYLEVAVNHGNARELFGIPQEETSLDYQTVRIFA